MDDLRKLHYRKMIRPPSPPSAKFSFYFRVEFLPATQHSKIFASYPAFQDFFKDNLPNVF